MPKTKTKNCKSQIIIKVLVGIFVKNNTTELHKDGSIGAVASTKYYYNYRVFCPVLF